MITTLVMINSYKAFAFRKYVPDHYPTIQYAIDHVNEIDTIVVRPGLYQENLLIGGKPIRLFSEFFINQDTALISGTIIDGSGHYDRVIKVDDESFNLCIIHGFTIQNGMTSGGGGGIECRDRAYVFIEHCKIRQNYAGQGGGIAVSQNLAVVTVNHTEITDNITDYSGGGIFVGNFCRVFLNNCLIKRNLAGMGGGIYNEAIPEALDYKFGLSVNRCIVTENWASLGGGLCNSGCPNEAKIVSSIFYNNHTRNIGPEIYAWNGNSIRVINTIIYNDSVLFKDAIVFLCEWNPGILQFDHSLIYGGEGTISLLDTVGTIIYGETNLDADPCFVDPANGDFHLEPYSPCIDAALDYHFIMPHLVLPGEQIWISINHALQYAPEGSELAPDLLVHISEEQIYGSAPDIGAYEYFPPINIKEDHNDDGLQIYPNPVSEILNIKLIDHDKSSSVFLFDAEGKLVYSGILSDENQQIGIDVSEFSPGLYFLQKGNEIYKIVVSF